MIFMVVRYKFEDKTWKELFLKYVKMGMMPYRAAVLSGAHLNSYYNWEKQKREDEEAGLTAENSRFIAFFDEIEAAKQENVAFHLNNINTAAKKGNWTASAWVLERVHGQEFKKVENVNLENDTINIVSSMPQHESEE